jgi:hypothetical protein
MTAIYMKTDVHLWYVAEHFLELKTFHVKVKPDFFFFCMLVNTGYKSTATSFVMLQAIRNVLTCSQNECEAFSCAHLLNCITCGLLKAISGSFLLLTGSGQMSAESSCNSVKTTTVLIYVARTAK